MYELSAKNDRLNFNRMIAEIEAGNVATVIVKDMSRLGRDYLKVGYYTEIFFVERDVRYIAICLIPHLIDT